MIEFEKSIHPALSAHAYPESVHGSRGFPDAAGVNSTFSSHTHQIVSTQKYPVRVPHTAIPHEYPVSVGCCQNFMSPGFPSPAQVVQESGVLIPQNIHGLCVAPPFHTRYLITSGVSDAKREKTETNNPTMRRGRTSDFLVFCSG